MAFSDFLRVYAFAVFCLPVQNDADKATIKQPILKATFRSCVGCSMVAFAKRTNADIGASVRRNFFSRRPVPTHPTQYPKPHARRSHALVRFLENGYGGTTQL